MTGDQIRDLFLTFYESKGHSKVASSSLIPVGDPTLLLTNAGMVQFKSYFSGDLEPPNRRLTTCQKAFRTVDIDEVGDATHLTLFEMLGNFSIGDYFKKGAIEYSLEFVTGKLGLPKEKFCATIHQSDDESFDLWQQAGVPKDKIYRFGDEDNWWGPPIHGSQGPCGPCSELHYDFGQGKGCNSNDCGPNCSNFMGDSNESCNRFVELWNLVFMQFDYQSDGSKVPLPAPGIDTGMGLERAAVILQGVNTIYETDLFTPLIKKVESLSDTKYGAHIETDYAVRAVAEHARSATFLIADGVVPGNEGRGYVLRRLIRRAIRHARRLGIANECLGGIAEITIRDMGSIYPELRNHREFIITTIQLEEKRFNQAFTSGYAVLEDALQGKNKLEGELVFRLWDTYGFPVEMTQEICKERGIEVDFEGFQSEMESQRQRARVSGKFTEDRAKVRVYESLGVGKTRFLGYEQVNASSVVVGLVSDGVSVNEVNRNQDVEVVLLETPFYAEGGGQVGDAGEISGPNGKIEIHDAQFAIPDAIFHFGKVVRGNISVGDTVEAYVNPIRREDTARNHSATHLLHAALRAVLGPHVRQAGSLVAAERLRFDFSHVQQVTSEEIELVERMVNDKIRQNAVVRKSDDTYVSAIERGALAFFGDKYDENVRLVEIANGTRFSLEVCGGTHVDRTGELGSVFIVGESSIGAGMRRIEAVSGRGADRLVHERLRVNNAVAAMLQTGQDTLINRVQSLLDELTDLRRAKENLETRLSVSAAEELLLKKQVVLGINVLATRVSVSNSDNLREISDHLSSKLVSGVIVLGSVIDGQPRINVSVTKDLVNRGIDARVLSKSLGKVMGGGGGGRQNMAHAGGRDPNKVDGALEQVEGFVKNLVESVTE